MFLESIPAGAIWQMLGLTTAVAVLSSYIFNRFTRFFERKDIERREQLATKILSIRKAYIEANGNRDSTSAHSTDNLTVYAIYRSVLAAELVQLSKDINPHYKPIRNILGNVSKAALFISAVLMFSTFAIVLGGVWFVIAPITGLTLLILGSAIVAIDAENYKLRIRAVTDALLMAQSEEDIDKVISMAMIGEEFTEINDDRKFLGKFLGLHRKKNLTDK